MALAAGIAAGVLVVLTWSGWLVVSRHGVQGELSIWDIMLLRFGAASLAVIPLALMRRKAAARMREPRIILASMGCGLPYVLFTFMGLKHAEAANAGIIVNGALPVASAILLLAFTGVRPGALQMLGMGLVVAANLALLGDGAVGLPAAAMFLAAAASLAFYIVAVKMWGLTTEEAVIVVPIVNAAFGLPLWFAFDGSFAGAPIKEIALQAFYQGLVVSVLANALFTFCIRHAGALAAALMMAFVPIATPLLAAVTVGGGRPGAALMAIAAVTTAGIAVCAIGAGRNAGRP